MNLRCGLKISDIFSEIVSVRDMEFLPYESEIVFAETPVSLIEETPVNN